MRISEPRRRTNRVAATTPTTTERRSKLKTSIRAWGSSTLTTSSAEAVYWPGNVRLKFRTIARADPDSAQDDTVKAYRNALNKSGSTDASISELAAGTSGPRTLVEIVR